jgi:hypothetical protein
VVVSGIARERTVEFTNLEFTFPNFLRQLPVAVIHVYSFVVVANYCKNPVVLAVDGNQPYRLLPESRALAPVIEGEIIAFSFDTSKRLGVKYTTRFFIVFDVGRFLVHEFVHENVGQGADTITVQPFTIPEAVERVALKEKLRVLINVVPRNHSIYVESVGMVKGPQKRL